MEMMMRNEKDGTIQFKINIDYTESFLNIIKNWDIPSGEHTLGNVSIAKSEIEEQMINNRVWALLILKIKGNGIGDIYSLQLKIGENNPSDTFFWEREVLLISEYDQKYGGAWTSVIWLNQKGSGTDLREITGRPLKLKELYKSIEY